jgi:hypothetical protein
VRVLVHELAHALGIGYREHGRRRAEVIVDTVTAVVCGSLGLDTSGSTVPYIAGWGEDGDLDAIRGCAEAIDSIARRIEDGVRSESQSRAGRRLARGVAARALARRAPPLTGIATSLCHEHGQPGL